MPHALVAESSSIFQPYEFNHIEFEFDLNLTPPIHCPVRGGSMLKTLCVISYRRALTNDGQHHLFYILIMAVFFFFFFFFY